MEEEKKNAIVANDSANNTKVKKDGEGKKAKRRFGDRKDARRLRDIDSMHAFMPYLLKNRTDNEAVMNDYISVEALEAYIAKKNADSPAFKYTVFHAVLAAIAKTVYQRPKMNYFYQGHRLYERNDISFAFTAKRQFEDGSDEALAIIKLDKDTDISPIEQMHSKVEKFVTKIRKKAENDGATDIMDIFKKFPRCILKMLVGIMRYLDYHGWMPKSFCDVDPYYCTFFVSNLGSIKATASYHHLTNWGTNSVFLIVGEMKKRLIMDKDGETSVKKVLPVGLTIDERIADGFYFTKSFKLFKYIIENPELLDKPLQETVEIPAK